MGRLKLIIGAAGSGKTQRILDDVARKALESPLPSAEHPPLLIIVPEQQAMQTERAVYARMEELSGCAAASARVNVMSFSRLASVLRTRAGQDYQPLGELGRRLLVWQLLGKGGKAKADVLAGLIGELATNGVMPEDLGEDSASPLQEGGTGGSQVIRKETELPVAVPYNEGDAGIAPTGNGEGGDGAPPLQEKLAELSEVYVKYCTACIGRKLDFLHPTCGVDALLVEENWQHLNHTEVWIDGFTGFTAPEERALGALLKQCKAIQAAVLIDPAQTRQASADAFADWFKPTRELFAWWKATAKELSITCEVQGLPNLPRWNEANPLTTLAMLKTSAAVGEAAGLAQAVACGDDRSEADFAARKIKELVTEQGYRYSDISIITRNISAYAGLIRARFTDHGIPFFIDEKRKLASHPAVVLFLSGLKMALGLAQPGDAQALLKTELLPGAEDTKEYRNQISLLEQAYTEAGKRPAAWLADTNWNSSEGSIDTLRREILAPVLELKAVLETLAEEQKTLQAVLGFAWDHLLPKRVADLLELWAESQEKTNPVEAQIQRGVLSHIAKSLDALVEIAGDEVLTYIELSGWLEYGFEEMTLAAPPPVLDSVLVTDIERGRHHPVKAVVMLGMAADTWPQTHSESAYLNDAERRQLADSAGKFLGDTASDKSAKEPYFAMVAATRTSELLVLTRPGSDSQGKAREPSGYYNHFCKLLGLTETTFTSRGDNADLASIASFNDLAVTAALGTTAGGLNALVDEIAATKISDITSTAIRARNWHCEQAQSNSLQARLDSAQMESLLPGPDYPMSASRLENFANCPFKHFAHYYLGLKEQSEPALDALQLGTFYHEVLQRIVEALIRQGYDWAHGSVDEFKRVAEAVLAEQSEQLKTITGRARSALIHDRALVLLEMHAEEISKLAGSSGRVPLGVEISFGNKDGDSLPAVRLPLGTGELVLGGKIDRVDSGADGSAAVVDYKLSARGVDWQLFLAGAQIQLPLYLMAVEGQVIEGQQSQPPMQTMGATYSPIEHSWNPRTDIAELNPSPLIPKPRKKADAEAQDKAAEMALVIAETTRVVGELGERILDGEFAPQPLRQPGSNGSFACTFCSFAPLCRFDPLAGGQPRNTDPRSNAELRDEIIGRGGDQHGG